MTAYEGGATLITSPTVLSYAARILAVEAYHAGDVSTTVIDALAQDQVLLSLAAPHLSQSLACRIPAASVISGPAHSTALMRMK